MKRILINEHREKAEAKLSAIEQQYVTRVTELKYKLHGLGIETVNKELLLAVIGGDIETVREKVFEICTPDIEAATSPIAKEQVTKAVNGKLGELHAYVQQTFADSRFKNTGLSLASIKSIFEIGEDGLAYIPEEKKDVIREGFKEYLDGNSAKIKAYELHHEAAKKIDACIKALVKEEMYDSAATGNGFTLLNLFEFKENPKTGEREVVARDIPYQSYKSISENIDKLIAATEAEASAQE